MASKRSTLALVLLACLVAAVAGVTIIRDGVKPFDRKTVIVCHQNALHTSINGAMTPVFWWNDNYWPLSGITALNLLPHDARSCTRITRTTGPLGGSVTTVNHGH